MAAHADLNDLLLAGGADPVEVTYTRTTPSLFNKRRVVIALVGILAVAAVVGIVVGSLSSSGKLSSSSSSTASSSADFQARPVFSAPIGSLSSLPAPTIVHNTKDKQTAHLSFTHTTVGANGRISHTRLNYNVTKFTHAHCPSNDLAVLGMICSPFHMQILFANATMARAYARTWVNGTVLLLRAEWGCGEHIRKFIGAPSVQGSVLSAHTANVSLGHVFESANITFFSNHSELGPDNYTALRAHRKPLHASHQRRSFLSSLGSFLEDIAPSALQFTAGLVTGDLSLDYPWTSSYALPTESESWDDDGDNGNSFSANFGGSVTLATDVNLQIQDYSITSFAATVTGTLQAAINMDLQAQGQFSKSQTDQLTSASLSTGSFEIFGVAIPLSLGITTYGGFSVTASDSASATGSINMNGQAVAGIQYDGTNVSPVGSASFTGTPSFPQPLVTASATASSYLSLALNLQGLYILNATGVITVYGDAALQASDAACTVNADTGVEVDVAAGYQLQIPGIDTFAGSVPMGPVYGPTQIWSGTSEC